MNKTHFMGILLATLMLGAQPLLAQTCNGSITASAPDSHYTDNGDGTVTDSQTGLMWRQCSEGQGTVLTECDTGSAATYTWQGALQRAQTVNGVGFGGHNDWRLPNRNELVSLIESRCISPAINETVFPNTGVLGYWSASPNASSSDGAWNVVFYSGRVSSLDKNNALYVRLVRGGQ